MKIIKVDCTKSSCKPIYLVVDKGFKEAEELFYKHNQGCVIKHMELVSEDVINLWAQ